MISIGKCNFRAFLCFGLILAAVLLCSVSPAREVAVIKVEHRWAAELVPIVKSMLSADGTVTVSERVNLLTPRRLLSVFKPILTGSIDRLSRSGYMSGFIQWEKIETAKFRPAAGFQTTTRVLQSAAKRKTVLTFQLKTASTDGKAIPNFS